MQIVYFDYYATLQFYHISIIMASKYELKFRDTYSGTEDLDLFLCRLESYSKLRDFAADKKVLSLGLRLTGPAALWFADLPDSEKTDYKTVTDALRLAFEGDSVRWVREAKLAERQQGENESIDLYFTDIVHLSRQLHRSDNEQMARFVRGLRPTLKAFVISKEPENMAQAINFARLGESVDKICKPPAIQSIEQSTCIKDEVTTKLDNLQTQVDNIVSLINSSKPVPVQPQQSFPHRSNRSHTQTYSKQSRFNGGCNRCGKYGHKQANCYSKVHIQGYPLN